MTWDPLLPSIFRDKAGNLREKDTNKPLHINGTNSVTAFTLAAANQATLAASTGNRWQLDGLQICLASVFVGTLEGTAAVIASVYDGTTVVHSQVLSRDGVYNLDLSKISVLGTSATALACRTSTSSPGYCTINLQAHKVTAADV